MKSIYSSSEFNKLSQSDGTLKMDSNGEPYITKVRSISPLEYTLAFGVLYHVYPKKINSYGLAWMWYLGKKYGEIDNTALVFIEEQLFKKISPIIEKIGLHFNEEEKSLFEVFIKRNIGWILNNILTSESKEFQYIKSEENILSQKRRKELNNQIFCKRLEDLLTAYTRTKYNIFNDFIECIQVCKDPSSFKIFEAKYHSILNSFARKYSRLLNKEYEDIFQEIQIKLWEAAQGYTGVNFARFSTYLHQVIKNFIRDLYRKRVTDSRIIDLYTSPTEGFDENDSYTAQKVAIILTQEWERRKRELDIIEEEDSEFFEGIIGLEIQATELLMNSIISK